MRSSRKSHRNIIVAAFSVAAGASMFHNVICAQTLYWDVNGSTAGAGGPTATGAWNGTATNWSTDSAGTVGTQQWTAGDVAIFSAGTDATGKFTVTVSGTMVTHGFTVEEGTVSFAGSTNSVSAASGSIIIQQGATLAVPNSSVVGPAVGVPTYLDGSTLSNTNPGNGGTFWSPNSSILLTSNGGTVDFPAAAGNSGIYRGIIGLSAGATTATLTKTGTGEFRADTATTANYAFTQLKVLGGLYRVGGTGVETGFGAVPANPTPDAIVLDGGYIGVSSSTVMNQNRGLTLKSTGGFNVTSASMTFNGTLTGTLGTSLNVIGVPSQNLTINGDNSNFFGNLTGTAMNVRLNSNLSVGSLSGTGTVTVSPGATLTAGVDNGNSTYGGSIAGINGGGAFVKSGSGSLTLTGTNTYNASTFAAGTLVADDAALGSLGITLDGGMTLKSRTGLTTSRSITINSGGAQLDGSTGGVTIQGTGNTTLGGNLTLAAGTITLNRNGGNVSIASGVGVSVNAGATANFNGTTSILFDGASSSADLTVNGTAGFGGDRTFGNLSGSGTINASAHALTINQSNNTVFSGALNASGSAITKNLGGSLTVNNVRVDSLIVNSGKVAIAAGGGTAGTSVLNGLTIAGGTLDISNHSLIVNYTPGNSPINSIRSAIASSYSGGAWNQPGLTSSVAAADPNGNTAVGYAEASDLGLANGGTFAGQTIAGQAVLAKYTYYGDENLDGVVNLDDFSIFIDGYNGLGTGWIYGDFNYDGAIDQNDFSKFVTGYNLNPNQNPPLSQLILSDSELSISQKSALLSEVPEPTSLCIFALCAGSMVLPRRRK